MTSRHQIRVLLIEDEAIFAFAISDALHDQGWSVVGPVGRIEPALEASEKSDFDCAIMNAHLHGVLADAVARNLTKRCEPFVLATGYDVDSLPPELRQASVKEAIQDNQPHRSREINGCRSD